MKDRQSKLTLLVTMNVFTYFRRMVHPDKTFVFTPEHFIRSSNGILNELESTDWTTKRASIINPWKIPRDKEYIVVVPGKISVSESLLKDTPDNVVFVVKDSHGCSPTTDIVRSSRSFKCFYTRIHEYAFSDRRFPGLRFRHIYYNGYTWGHDDLTLEEYFRQVIPRKC